MANYLKLFFIILLLAYICGIISGAEINFFKWPQALRDAIAGWTGGLFCFAAMFLTILQDQHNPE